MEASYGVTVNYRYLPDELEENHERFVRGGQIRVPSSLFREHKTVADAWDPARKSATRKTPLTPSHNFVRRFLGGPSFSSDIKRRAQRFPLR